MAFFTNYATLSYNGLTRSSNTVTGEILETVTATKTAVTEAYAPGDTVTYVITLMNSGAAAITGLTLSDDLGGYTFDAGTVYPLAYTAGSVRYFINGVPQTAPAVTAGPPLVIGGLSIPAGGNATLVYETRVTEYAPPASGGTVANTITVTGGDITVPVTASETITAADGAQLSISKALSPSSVAANGQLTYTFTLENTGNAEAGAADGVVLSDTFDPTLSGLTVTFNGVPWAAMANYTYDEGTGAFATLPGQITVPAAVYAQGADGAWSVTPGTATLVVTGTVQTGT